MKKIAAIILTLALFPAISFAAQETGSRIYVVSGSVFVTQGKNPARRVTNGEPVVSDTLVSTGDKSAALLKFEDGQVVTMQANSTFHVREYRYDARQAQNSNIIFSMLKGGMRFATGLIGQQNKRAFRLLTPHATIGIRGTDFMLTMSGTSMYGQVLAGNIGMTNAAGTALFSEGQFAAVASSSALASAVSASAIPSGTFSELLSIPVNPAAITAPATVPVQAPVAAPVAAAASGAVAGVSLAGGALAGLAGSDSDSKQADKKETGAGSKSGIGMTAKIGTLGYGAELNFGISDSVSTRVGYNAFTYKHNADSSLVNYDLKWQLQTASAVVDWYPFTGSFRTSVGLLYDDNNVSFDANPTGGNYTINGTIYPTTQIGSLKGKMSFKKAAPYIGIGWGNPVATNKGWGLTTDFGALYQGEPRIDLTATCLSICTQLQTDTAAEQTKLQNDLRDFKWWPVVTIGISYQW